MGLFDRLLERSDAGKMAEAIRESTGKDIRVTDALPGGKKRIAERNIARTTGDIRKAIENLPQYEIPPEVQQQLDLLTQSAETIRGTTGLAEEATDIARARTGMSELPGEGVARRDIRSSTAGTVQNILEAGGGSASTLGAIAQVGLGEQSAFGQLAQQRAQYRSQAEQDLANALRTQAGMTAQAEAQAAGLESAGLMGMASERGKQYEYDLSKELTGLQFDVDQLAGMRQAEQERRNRNAAIFSSVLSTLGQLGGTAISTLATGGAGGATS